MEEICPALTPTDVAVVARPAIVDVEHPVVVFSTS